MDSLTGCYRWFGIIRVRKKRETVEANRDSLRPLLAVIGRP